FLVLRRRQATPPDTAGEAKPVQPFRRVVLHARSQDLRLPSASRELIPVQQLQNGLQTLGSFTVMVLVHSLPREQKTLKLSNRHGLNLRAQAIDREPMYSGQQSAVAPFEFRGARPKFAAQDEALTLESDQAALDFRGGHPEEVAEF